jgi:hypothetical protein
MLRNSSLESTVRECLIDGKWVSYDMCSQDYDAYDKVENRIYLGQYEECRINGVVQSVKELYHYWQRGI